MPFGAKIRELRIKKGLTQSELAEGICTPSMISLIESDRANPSDKVLLALADRLGVTLEELQRGESSVWEQSSCLLMADALLLDHQLLTAKQLLLGYTPETETFARYHKLLLAECHIQEGNYVDALSVLEALEEQSQGDPISISHVWLKMGKLYIETGNYALGSHYYKKAYHLCLSEKSITLIDKLHCIAEVCLFYLQENRHQELAGLLTDIQSNASIPVTMHDLGKLFLLQAQDARNDKRFQLSHDLAHSAHALLSSMKLIKGMNSLQFYLNNMHKDHQQAPVPWEAAIHPETLAVLHLNAGNLDKAMAMTELALRQAVTPREKTVALQTLTHIQEARGEYMQAAETLRAIIQIWEQQKSTEQVTKYSSYLTQIMLRAAAHLHENRE